jgi:phosphoribosylamine--glycine ligase
MGTYSPYFSVDDPIVERARQEILEPTLNGMRSDGHPFRGVLYAGLMLTESGPQVIEYNVRFGDPEVQSLLIRLRSDFLELVERAIDGELRGYCPEWNPRHAVCVIAASGGYPGSYATGKAITGLDSLTSPDVKVYHSGTARGAHEDGSPGEIVTSGGRVLGVTALGDTRDLARERAYGALENIRFEGMQFRKDIGLGDR